MILPGCVVVMAVPTPRGFNSACNSVEGTAATCPGTRGLFSVSTCPCGVITTLAAVSVREAEESSARQDECKTLIYSGTAPRWQTAPCNPALGTALEGVILLFLPTFMMWRSPQMLNTSLQVLTYKKTLQCLTTLPFNLRASLHHIES